MLVVGQVLRSSWWRETALAAVAFGAAQLALWLYVRDGFSTLGGIASSEMSTHLDYDIFWHSARAWLDGGNPFRDTGAPDISNNPPFFTLLFLPLALLDPLIGYRFWTLIMLLAQTGSLAWMASELRVRTGWAIATTTALLLSAPLLGTLAIGQMYPLLTLGLVAAWIADRRGKDLFSGCALGLVVAVKPSLAPVVLWPLVRKRWKTFAASAASGGVTTLVGILAVGLGPTLDWITILRTKFLDGSWDNASLPGAAARLFRENRFAEPLVEFPSALTLAVALGLVLLVVTMLKVRLDPAVGLWALVAASLLASPVTWHNYLLMLTPGVLLLFTKGRTALAVLLISVALIPQQWVGLWEEQHTVMASIALALYSYILVLYWVAFLTTDVERDPQPDDKPRSPRSSTRKMSSGIGVKANEN